VYVEDEAIHNYYCWRCSEFIAALIQAAAGSGLTCSCGAHVGLPQFALGGKGQEVKPRCPVDPSGPAPVAQADRAALNPVDTGEKRCPECKTATYSAQDRDRPSSSTRGYNRNHYRLRKMVMADQPLCLLCEAEGRIVPGVELDHIDGDPWNLERENLQMLCKKHHSVKTVRKQGGFSGRT